MQQILATGVTGLIGSRLTLVLHNFEFLTISRKDGADITQKESLRKNFSSFTGKFVLHMAAKADVDGCEEDKEMGEQGDAWKINVLGTQNVAELCKEYNKKIIYISTDFVFNGEKKQGDAYTEEDIEQPVNWYGETKFQGEQRVKKSGAEYLILRIAYPYGVSSAEKRDFVRIIASRIKNNQPVAAVTDHIFVPTYIDDLSYAIKRLIELDAAGTYHVVGSDPLTPYDAARLIAKEINADPEAIGKTTREDFFHGRAKRPFNLYLSNGKIENLGIRMEGFAEGIHKMSM
ncbi:MAG TPA: NAD(P)-dependent oxidoreductase [Candidatus Levybacteria bacterium]|nr:NAD(P)-dependent oxidoreductase [Candidatus Levybacteria bacterium]